MQHDCHDDRDSKRRRPRRPQHCKDNEQREKRTPGNQEISGRIEPRFYAHRTAQTIHRIALEVEPDGLERCAQGQGVEQARSNRHHCKSCTADQQQTPPVAGMLPQRCRHQSRAILIAQTHREPEQCTGQRQPARRKFGTVSKWFAKPERQQGQMCGRLFRHRDRCVVDQFIPKRADETNRHGGSTAKMAICQSKSNVWHCKRDGNIGDTNERDIGLRLT